MRRCDLSWTILVFATVAAAALLSSPLQEPAAAMVPGEASSLPSPTTVPLPSGRPQTVTWTGTRPDSGRGLMASPQGNGPLQITVSPVALTSSLYVNAIVTTTLTISNDSSVALTYDLAGAAIEGPVLLMHLDEPPGSTAFLDASGHGNDGACSGAGCPAAGTPGRHGGALSFDGMDDMVQAGTTAFPTGNGDRTLALWVKARSFLANEAWFAGYGNVGGWGQVYEVFAYGDILHFSQWGLGLAGPSLQVGRWYHVAVTNQGDFVRLYLDGSPVAEGYIAFDTPPGTHSYLGRAPGIEGISRRFDGLIDQVVVYPRALSPDEMRALYLHVPGGGVRWLTAEPISGTVPAGASAPVQITFDATAIQPGEYTTEIVVRSTDPVSPWLFVPVTMTVLPTTAMGWVEGTVTDAWTGEPLQSTITARDQPFTVTSDLMSGQYRMWLDAGSYNIRAAAPGHFVKAVTVTVSAQQGTTQDLVLDWCRVYLPVVRKAPPPTPTPTPTVTPTPRPSRGLYGVVTEGGALTAGVPLDLRFYDGANWSTRASTTTGPGGAYSFLSQPGLGGGATLLCPLPERVRWQLQPAVDVAHSGGLTDYAAGAEVHAGSFDVAGISSSPSPNARSRLPATFQWTVRPASPSDNYEFDLFDPVDQSPYFWTDPPLGYVGWYTLTGLPAGFSAGTRYGWECMDSRSRCSLWDLLLLP